MYREAVDEFGREAEYNGEYPILNRRRPVGLFPVENIPWVEVVAGLTFGGKTLRLFDLSNFLTATTFFSNTTTRQQQHRNTNAHQYSTHCTLLYFSRIIWSASALLGLSRSSSRKKTNDAVKRRYYGKRLVFWRPSNNATTTLNLNRQTGKLAEQQSRSKQQQRTWESMQAGDVF
ncbi:hypothetical protein BJ508DRAFT_371590 [Ascobolus immersus RN42]|uniref:Uncharacterized protein n=1 Tax=Ascobolus immersus RN42 TaxID=1160509 RepID=A0A3N4IQR9_ASCIM|nr:hypothetical protein BJ508DRAFT_371590 [Ascobolus immersus RN42]